MNKENIKAIECRHVVYSRNRDSLDDIHLVKEIVHTNDGKVIPNIRILSNYKRDFYITKKGFRTHNQKKELESLDKLVKYQTTQTRLNDSICNALNTFNNTNNLRKINRSPYIYGTDILSTAIIKKNYQKTYPDVNTPSSVAVYDIETDVINGTDEIIMATISFGSKVITVIKKDFLSGYSNVLERLNEAMNKYLSKFITERNIKWEVLLVDTPGQIVSECFKKAHEWSPDFLSIWNMDFDIPKSVAALEKEHIDPAIVFSDPKVPYKYKYFKYKQGPKQKVTASGKMTPIKPAAQWHTVYCPAGFYIIDSMCAYRHIRTGSQEEESYALDFILDKEFKDKPEIRKLKFEEAKGLKGIDWHKFMQSKYPIEYVIYNVFDCISVELLDEKINDLSITLSMNSGCSDYENFKSQPRRLVDDLHFFYLDKGYVIGSTSDQMVDECDASVVGLNEWIITLPSHLVTDTGLRVIEENPDIRTKISIAVGDLDVTGAYPNNGSVFNISKETTYRELVSIEDVTEKIRRNQGINLSGGHTNAVEICTSLFHLPTMDMLLDSFAKQNVINT